MTAIPGDMLQKARHHLARLTSGDEPLAVSLPAAAWAEVEIAVREMQAGADADDLERFRLGLGRLEDAISPRRAGGMGPPQPLPSEQKVSDLPNLKLEVNHLVDSIEGLSAARGSGGPSPPR